MYVSYEFIIELVAEFKAALPEGWGIEHHDFRWIEIDTNNPNRNEWEMNNILIIVNIMAKYPTLKFTHFVCFNRINYEIFW